MQVHPIEPEELMAYLDGELAAGRALLAADHLGSCRECQALVADLRRVSERMLDWRVEAAEFHAPRVKPVDAEAAAGRRPWFLWRPVWAGAAAVVALTAILGTRVQDFGAHKMAMAPPPQPAASTQQVTARLEQFAKLQRADPLVENGALGPLIARTARLSLVAKDFNRVNDAIEAILKHHHGFAAEMNIVTDDSSARTLDASLRTPSADLDATIAELKVLGRVTRESRTGEDVTQQSTDLDARLANARNEEQVLTDLMKHRTSRLSDVLEVERQLSSTRGEIEQMEAERKNLDKRIDYARIDLQVTEVYKAQLDDNRTGALAKLRNASVEGVRNVSESLVSAAAFALSDGPVVLIWCAVLGVPVWWAVRKWRRRVR